MTPSEHLNAALAKWPNFGVEHSFLARIQSATLDASQLESFVPDEFYLATAALRGVTPAVQAVEALVAAQFAEMGHFRLENSVLDELRSSLLVELLSRAREGVGGGLEAGGGSRLERYAGTGPLAAWLRVVATRHVLTWLRKSRRDPIRGDDVLLGGLESKGENPELQLLKARCGSALSSAFHAALGSLEPRQRNLLRQHYLDELSLEEVATLYRVHRATAARWLASARETLLTRTREELCRALKLEPGEVESVMRLVQSRLELSAGVFLSGQFKP